MRTYIKYVTSHLPYPCFSRNFGYSLQSRSMILWSLHTEITRDVGRQGQSAVELFSIYYDLFDHDTSHFVNFAAFPVSMTLNLA